MIQPTTLMLLDHCSRRHTCERHWPRGWCLGCAPWCFAVLRVPSTYLRCGEAVAAGARRHGRYRAGPARHGTRGASGPLRCLPGHPRRVDDPQRLERGLNSSDLGGKGNHNEITTKGSASMRAPAPACNTQSSGLYFVAEGADGDKCLPGRNCTDSMGISCPGLVVAMLLVGNSIHAWSNNPHQR